jgi:hypothetical protein
MCDKLMKKLAAALSMRAGVKAGISSFALGADGNHHIERGDLIIPFGTLLLAAPGKGEGDFIFTKETLFIWAAIDTSEQWKRDTIRSSRYVHYFYHGRPPQPMNTVNGLLLSAIQTSRSGMPGCLTSVASFTMRNSWRVSAAIPTAYTK